MGLQVRRWVGMVVLAVVVAVLVYGWWSSVTADCSYEPGYGFDPVRVCK